MRPSGNTSTLRMDTTPRSQTLCRAKPPAALPAKKGSAGMDLAGNLAGGPRYILEP